MATKEYHLLVDIFSRLLLNRPMSGILFQKGSPARALELTRRKLSSSLRLGKPEGD